MADHIQIGDVAPRIQYTGDGAQTVFTYPFPVFKASDIEVYLDDALQESGYAVDGAGESLGGDVMFSAAPASGTLITLRRRIAIQRTADFQESGEFRAKVINDELDYLTAALQQVSDDGERALRLRPTDPTGSLALPAKAQRSGLFLAFDDNGDPVASDASGPPGPQGPAGNMDGSNNLSELTDAAQARANLGLGQAAVESVAAGGAGGLLRASGDGSALTGIADDAARANIVLNAFRIAVQGGLSIQNMVDGVVDEFEDQTGVDDAASTGETYDATNDCYANIEAGSQNDTWGNAGGGGLTVASGVSWGIKFTAGATGVISAVKINIEAAGSGAGPDNVEARLYTNNAGSPGTTIGSASDTVDCEPIGDKTFTFATPPDVTSGTIYWLVFARLSSTGEIYVLTGDAPGGFGSGKHATITSIADSGQTPAATGDDWNVDIALSVVANMTLYSEAFAALAQPDEAFIVVWQQDVDAVTLNADLKAYASRDGGTTWTQITLAEEASLSTGRVLAGSADISGQPAGTSMKWKLETLNAKEMKIHGVGLEWS